MGNGAETTRLQSRFFLECIKVQLDNVRNVLRSAATVYCCRNFPELLVQQYHISEKADSILRRYHVMNEDTSGAVLCKLQEYGYTVYKETGRNGATQWQGLDKVSNEDFLSAVRVWLYGLDVQQQVETTRRLLRYLDVAAAIKIFRFTTVNGATVMLQMLSRNSAVEEERLSDMLKSLNDIRNEYYGHNSDASEQRLTVDKTKAVLQELRNVAELFSGEKEGEIAAAYMEFCRENIRRCEMLSYPPIDVRQEEDRYGFRADVLLRALAGSEYIKYLSKPEKKLYYVSQQEFRRFVIGCQMSERLVAETNTKPEHTLSQADDAMARIRKLQTLRSYADGKLRKDHLQELADVFILFADTWSWLSENGRLIINNVVIPELKTLQRKLYVEWGTLMHIYRLEKTSTDPDVVSNAKTARLMIYHLYKTGLIRYVGTVNSPEDPVKSLVQFLRRNARVPVGVITADSVLIDQLNRRDTPFCMCLNLWGYHALSVRSESKDRLKNLLSGRVEGCEELPMTGVPGVGDTVFDKDGNSLKLCAMIGQSGGEGTVYATDRPSIAAKIYHLEKLTPQRKEKLLAMCSVPVEGSGIGWLKSILTDNRGHFVGFLMVQGSDDAVELQLSVLKLAGSSVRQSIMSGWDRRSVVRCCITVCEIFMQLHNHKVLMGDVNPRNILVSTSDPAKVFFVDCDSYQFDKYLCPVGVAEYSSPEMLKRIEGKPNGYASCPRTMEDEQFSMAVLLFKMLMLGSSPFAAKNTGTAAGAEYVFAFRSGENSGRDAPDGPYRLIWSNTPKNLKNMFTNTFGGQGVYSAARWRDAFHSYLADIDRGKYTSLLLPKKYFDPGNMFVDFICAECGEEANMALEMAERLEDKAKFCNHCRQVLMSAKDIPQRLLCKRCGCAFTGTVFDLLMEKHGRGYLCDDCRRKR